VDGDDVFGQLSEVLNSLIIAKISQGRPLDLRATPVDRSTRRTLVDVIDWVCSETVVEEVNDDGEDTEMN
jgi:hypothetical protein